jgi:hypothetical protein
VSPAFTAIRSSCRSRLVKSFQKLLSIHGSGFADLQSMTQRHMSYPALRVLLSNWVSAVTVEL